MSPEIDFTLPVTEEEYEEAGSAFIEFPGAKRGDIFYVDAETEAFDWKQAGVSIIIPVTIMEGSNKGKPAELYAGVRAKNPDGSPGGLWKFKQVYKNVTGEEMPMIDTPQGKSPRPDRLAFAGKKVVARIDIVEGRRDGGTGDSFDMAKLVDILPAGSKPNK